MRTEVAILFDADWNEHLFVTNPNGAMADALIAENRGTSNKDWDGVWEVKAQQAKTWEPRWNPTQTTVLTKLVWMMAF